MVNDEMSLSQYLSQASKLDGKGLEKGVKVALVGSYTLQGLKEVLEVKCHKMGVKAEVYEADYGQVHQVILDESSALYASKPDITYLLFDTRFILGDLTYDPYSLDVDGRKRAVSEKVEEIIELATSFMAKAKTKLVVSNLPMPTYSPYGILEDKTEYSLKDMVVEFNQVLKDRLQPMHQAYVYDFSRFIAFFGQDNVTDEKMRLWGDMTVGPQALPWLGEDLMSYLIPLVSSNKKCIVLDLDNTLWGGIVGEDGINGIKLGPEPPGNAYLEFQKRLLALFNRGIILAVNSRNNPDDALSVLREHPHMVLRDEHFASICINWNDKATNLKEIADELNIGLDSIVFIDDDPLNRELVRKYLPQVYVVDLPSDCSQYSKTLMGLNLFNTLQITKDDKKRGAMYAQERKRTKQKEKFTDMESFLRDLKIKVSIKRADEYSIPRISQLTLRTNQYNLTTKRYQEEDVKAMVESHEHRVYSAAVADRFGDYGIAGAAITCDKGDGVVEVDTFLLSCRIIGRGVEKKLLDHIIRESKKAGANAVRGVYVPTKKNPPSSSLYPDNGFRKVGEGIYELKIK